jgi:hypothetical protein
MTQHEHARLSTLPRKCRVTLHILDLTGSSKEFSDDAIGFSDDLFTGRYILGR